MKKIEAPITPSVIKWCREKAGFSIDIAAKKIGRPSKEIIAWEKGALKPTLSQLRKASEVYKRPLAVFFLPEPPKDFTVLRDFRSIPDGYRDTFSPALSLLVRETFGKQEWMREYLQNEGMAELEFIGSANLESSEKNVADNIRRAILVDVEEQKSCATREEVLRLWIDKIEASGIFVFRQRIIDLVEARGFVLCDKYAPFVFINANDAKAGQLFTLTHELVHLWLNESGISNMEPVSQKSRTAESQIEQYCNRVAAEVLVESASFEYSWKETSREHDIERRIEMLSNEFKVSEEVIARKLLELDRITRSKYEALRSNYQERWRKIDERERKLQKEKKPEVSYYRLKAFNNGYSFTRTVLSAYSNGAISGRDISYLLGVKLNQIVKLAECAGSAIDFREFA